MPGMAIHQLGHALGLVHTHTRVDRDNFINIHKENTDERRFGDDGAAELRQANCWDLESKCRHDHFGIAVRNACPLTCLMCLNVDTLDTMAATNKLLSGRYENAVRWLSYYDDLLDEVSGKPATLDHTGQRYSSNDPSSFADLLQATQEHGLNAIRLARNVSSAPILIRPKQTRR